MLLLLEAHLLLLLGVVELLGLVLEPLGDSHSLLLVAEECLPPVLVDLGHLPLLVGELLALLALLLLLHGVVLVPDVLLDWSVQDVALVALHCK